jgi:decaprenylphospho-beta-D-ribofuranose 2-oxidase
MIWSTERLAGWGNYPVERCHVARPWSVESLRSSVLDRGQPDLIPRGMGRAYGDAALNRDRGVILGDSLNHLLSFDEATGVLECEAGVSLAEIIDHLLPRGWRLPTTPGTKYITIGGAIAADVHGKNHHRDGSFGDYVLDFRLLIASGEQITCSRDRNDDVFWATLGGMGLTGCVISARVQLVRAETAYVAVDFRRTSDLDETLDCFGTTDRAYRYSVAWIDCLATGRSLGRSVLMLGEDARPDDLPEPLRARPLDLPRKRQKSVPLPMPATVLNRLVVKCFNHVYYASHPDGRRILDHDSFFYPLDGVHHWNRIYGRRGFVQYQALFPPETSRQGLIRLLERVAGEQRASFLAVLKSSGPASGGMLSYLYPGHTLAMDFPNTGDDLLAALRGIDRILLDHGGRVYLAKDAVTTPESFREMYPRLPEFLEVKHRVDSENRFASTLSRRLGIACHPGVGES